MKYLFLFAAISTIANVGLTATYYVATDGSSGNTGAIGSPWDRASVFAEGNPKSLACGDIINFRGGNYDGPIIVYGQGCEGNPITFQNYAGETVSFDSSSFEKLLGAEAPTAVLTTWSTSQYLKFRRNPDGGWFVIQNSSTTRIFPAGSSTPGDPTFCYPSCRPDGIADIGDYNEFENLVIANTGLAITSQSSACGSSYRGNIVHYNYWRNWGSADSGHALYIQNDTGVCTSTKTVSGNVFFSNNKADQFYGSSGTNIRDMVVTDNIWANHANGTLLVGGIGTALVGRSTYSANVIFSDIQSTRYDAFRFYQIPCDTCTFKNNYFIVPGDGSGGDVFEITSLTLTNTTESGNKFIGPNPGAFATSQFPNSTFATSDSNDYVREISTNSVLHRFLVAIDNNGGGVSFTPENCNSGQWLHLRDIMDYSKARPDYSVRCGAGDQTLPLYYYGKIQEPIGGMPEVPDTPYPFPFHTGSRRRVFLASVSDQCVGEGCPVKIQARAIRASGGVSFR